MFLAIIGLLIGVISYFWATDNRENEEISKLPRWMYLASIPVTFWGLGSVFAYAMIWSQLFIPALFTIPGLAISLGQIKKVRDNRIQVIQNTWFTGKTSRGTILRLFTRGGTVPLLHGEVLRESYEEEMRERVLRINYMETDDNSPVNVKLIYWIRPDFSHIQQILEVSHDSSKWWQRVENTADGLIKARASDLLKRKKSDDAIESKDRVSVELQQDRASESYFFQKEIDMGFKIVEMRFADIDHTDDVRAANEQIQKSAAYGRAVEALATSMHLDLEELRRGTDTKEYERIMRDLMDRVQTNSGKRTVTDHNHNLRIVGAEAEDFVDKIGGPVGKIINALAKSEGEQ